MTRSLHILALVMLASACGLSQAPDFGEPCEADRGCARGLVCVGARASSVCLPPTPPPPPETRGRTCAAPLPLDVAGAPYFGTVTAPFTEHDTSERTLTHAVGRALHLRVDVPAAGDSVVRVSVDAPFAVRLVWSALDACDSADRYDTSPGGADELVVSRTAPGVHHLVVVADASARADAITITVEQAPCPAGFLPDPAGCFGFATYTDADPRVAFAIGATPDRRVIMAGGDAPGDAAARSADIFDLRTGRITATSLPYERSGAPGVVMSDGSFIVVGGARTTTASSVARLSPSGALFTENPEATTDVTTEIGCAAATLPPPHLAFASCPGQPPSLYTPITASGPLTCTDDVDCPGLGTRCVAVLDSGAVDPQGWCACIDANCSDDFANAHWQAMQTLGPVPRRAHYAVALGSGGDTAVLVGGGFDRDDQPSAPFVLSPAARTLFPLYGSITESLAQRADARAVRTGGDIVIAGGTGLFDALPFDFVEIFDPARDEAARTVALAFARARTATIALDDTHVMIIGGVIDGAPTVTTEILDVAALSVARGPELPIPLSEHEAVALADGGAVVAGGLTTGGAYNEQLFHLTRLTATLDAADTVHDGRVSGDRCDEAIPLAGTSGVITSDTIGFGRDLSATRFGNCTDNYPSQGPDVVYAIDVPRAVSLHAHLESELVTDLSLYVLTGCDEGDACVAGSDTHGATLGVGGSEDLTVAPVDDDRHLFVVVDSAVLFNGVEFVEGAFQYTLTWSLE